MVRKTQFANDQIYHIYNRGVEKRQIFMNNDDYFRFIHNLYEFNDIAPASKFSSKKLSEVEPQTMKKRVLLVDIVAFCLMPNHFHLLVKQNKNNGITKILHKLGTGYTMYFNEKYDRVGPLFQGKFKATIVDTDEYFLQVMRYIHLNPIGIIKKDWKMNGIQNWQETNNFLNKYRWSSHLDYCGQNNFSSVISKNFLEKFFDNAKDYHKFVNEYVAEDLIQIKELF